MRLTAAQVRKAITAFVVPALVGLAAALADGHVTGAEWSGIAVTALTTASAVFIVPNAGPPSTTPPPTTYDAPMP